MFITCSQHFSKYLMNRSKITECISLHFWYLEWMLCQFWARLNRYTLIFTFITFTWNDVIIFTKTYNKHNFIEHSHYMWKVGFSNHCCDNQMKVVKTDKFKHVRYGQKNQIKVLLDPKLSVSKRWYKTWGWC